MVRILAKTNLERKAKDGERMKVRNLNKRQEERGVILIERVKHE